MKYKLKREIIDFINTHEHGYHEIQDHEIYVPNTKETYTINGTKESEVNLTAQLLDDHGDPIGEVLIYNP
jgi:hypothetical protein